MVRELLSLNSRPRHCTSNDIQNVTIVIFSNDSHSSRKDVYGQSGNMSELKIATSTFTWYHLLIWSCHKQRKVCYNSIGAEIPSATDADDRGFYLKQSLFSLFSPEDNKQELVVDSKSLFVRIATLHTTGYYRLRGIVSRIRDSFEGKKLNVIKWIPGSLNLAGVMTKRNISAFKKLNFMRSTGL